MSDKCTKNGRRLWLSLYGLFLTFLLIDFAFLGLIYNLNPALGVEIGFICLATMSGTYLGNLMLNRGLTDKRFLMPMRSALTIAGTLTIMVSLVGGMMSGILLL